MIRRGLLLSLLPLAFIIGASLWGFMVVEPGVRIPVHWSLDGLPDRFGGPVEAFLGLPAVALGVTLLLAALPKLDPRGDNLHRSAHAYLTAWLGTLWLLALTQAGIVLTAIGVWEAEANGPMPRLAVAGAALLVAAVGNYLGKTRPNWMLGVRTPWTLTSDLTWERTHRLAGRLLVAVGLVSAATSLAYPIAGLLTLTTGVLASALASIAHSYFVWRHAPDKQVGPQTVD